MKNNHPDQKIFIHLEGISELESIARKRLELSLQRDPESDGIVFGMDIQEIAQALIESSFQDFVFLKDANPMRPIALSPRL